MLMNTQNLGSTKTKLTEMLLQMHTFSSVTTTLAFLCMNNYHMIFVEGSILFDVYE